MIGKFWHGSDLRWYFLGALDSNFNDTAGMTKVCGTDAAPAFCAGASNDGASTLQFELNAASTPVFAPQRPVRAVGGFLDVSFPLSRIFRANATGRNAGWQINFHYVFDQAKTSDVLHLGNQRSKNDLAAATLCWKMNNLVSSCWRSPCIGPGLQIPASRSRRPSRNMKGTQPGSGTTFGLNSVRFSLSSTSRNVAMGRIPV